MLNTTSDVHNMNINKTEAETQWFQMRYAAILLLKDEGIRYIKSGAASTKKGTILCKLQNIYLSSLAWLVYVCILLYYVYFMATQKILGDVVLISFEKWFISSDDCCGAPKVVRFFCVCDFCGIWDAFSGALNTFKVEKMA